VKVSSVANSIDVSLARPVASSKAVAADRCVASFLPVPLHDDLVEYRSSESRSKVATELAAL
jgi:hypothetical protein